jgi:hypothetical protein
MRSHSDTVSLDRAIRFRCFFFWMANPPLALFTLSVMPNHSDSAAPLWSICCSYFGTHLLLILYSYAAPSLLICCTRAICRATPSLRRRSRPGRLGPAARRLPRRRVRAAAAGHCWRVRRCGMCGGGAPGEARGLERHGRGRLGVRVDSSS